MPSKHPRIESVIAASHGEPREVLKGVVDDPIRNALSEQQQSRLSSAETSIIRIFPDQIGRYTVRSPDGERGNHTRYAVDMKYEHGKTCTCGDYMFRCDPQSGQMCKHLWRAKILILLGALPDEDREPYDWLLDELVRDTNLLEELESGFVSNETSPSERMAALVDDVKNTHRIAVDYPRICTARANILKSVYKL